MSTKTTIEPFAFKPYRNIFEGCDFKELLDVPAKWVMDAAKCEGQQHLFRFLEAFYKSVGTYYYPDETRYDVAEFPEGVKTSTLEMIELARAGVSLAYCHVFDVLKEKNLLTGDIIDPKRLLRFEVIANSSVRPQFESLLASQHEAFDPLTRIECFPGYTANPFAAFYFSEQCRKTFENPPSDSSFLMIECLANRARWLKIAADAGLPKAQEQLLFVSNELKPFLGISPGNSVRWVLLSTKSDIRTWLFSACSKGSILAFEALAKYGAENIEQLVDEGLDYYNNDFDKIDKVITKMIDKNDFPIAPPLVIALYQFLGRDIYLDVDRSKVERVLEHPYYKKRAEMIMDPKMKDRPELKQWIKSQVGAFEVSFVRLTRELIEFLHVFKVNSNKREIEEADHEPKKQRLSEPEQEKPLSEPIQE